jgi:hypothetical protein
MEMIAILRVLQRHRLLALAGLPLAALVGLALMYQVSLFPPGLASKDHASGVATQRLLIAAADAPSFGLGTDITGTLAGRAVLLGDLMSTDAVRADIARRAGLTPSELAIIGPSQGKPPLEISLAVAATEVANATTEPYLIAVSADGTIPIISMSVAAPNAAGAARVADAAAASLLQVMKDKTKGAPGLQIERLGLPQAKTIVDGPRKVMGVAAAFVFMVLWCSGIVLCTGLLRQWRRRHPATAAATAAGLPAAGA